MTEAEKDAARKELGKSRQELFVAFNGLFKQQSQ